MAEAEPLRRYETAVLDAWLDYNGHMNEAYYLVVFSQATDLLMDRIGLDDASRRARRRTIYTLETHLRYLREVAGGVVVRVTQRVLELDAKRVRLFQEMHRSDDDTLLATAEMMLLSIDMTGPRAAPFEQNVHAALEDLQREQSHLPPPEAAGRGIGLSR